MTNQDLGRHLQHAARSLPILAETAYLVHSACLDNSSCLARVAIALHHLTVALDDCQARQSDYLQWGGPLKCVLRQLDSIAQGDNSSNTYTSDDAYYALEALVSEDLPYEVRIQKYESCKQSWLPHIPGEKSRALLKTIESALEQMQVASDGDFTSSFIETDHLEEPPEYPAFVNDKVYQALQEQTICELKPGQVASTTVRHAARLMLTPKYFDSTREDRLHTFNMMFPKCLEESEVDDWHPMQLLMSCTSKYPTWKNYLAPPEPNPYLICHLAQCNKRRCILLHFRKYHYHLEAGDDNEDNDDESIYDIPDTDQVSANSCSTYTLRQLLDSSPSFGNRACLAYVIAKSVWQYYNSQWMTSPWTHRDLIFMQQSRGSGALNDTCKLFLSAKFEKTTFHDTLEMRRPITARPRSTIPRQGLLHTSPIVLALGLTLLEIGSALECIIDDPPTWDGATINKLWRKAMKACKNSSDTTADLSKTTYFEVVKACFRPSLFKACPFNPENPDQGLQERRRILYQEIVHPLRRLVENTGWLDSWQREFTLDFLPLAEESIPHPLSRNVRENSSAETLPNDHDSYDSTASMQPPAADLRKHQTRCNASRLCEAPSNDITPYEGNIQPKEPNLKKNCEHSDGQTVHVNIQGLQFYSSGSVRNLRQSAEVNNGQMTGYNRGRATMRSTHGGRKIGAVRSSMRPPTPND